ncbi:hypothetical protein [Phenylobacterium aquaticum]|uniref:hypothetical protein n=1 Tax=Phenylobacterium aquaticum TaxID=1763816 RepID=UPI0026F19405|nr:hypothetical protein [Phenylobacterium aquaticum]
MSEDDAPTAAKLIVEALKARPPEDRGLFLRQLIAHAAAGLSLLEGARAASEAVYRLGDAVVARPGA